MINLFLFLGLAITLATFGAIIWSIVYPQKRVWPPQRYTAVTPFIVWIPTFLLFGLIIAVGVTGWGEINFPHWLRYGVGILLIVVGNIVVWSEVLNFGISQTGGAIGSLKTTGFYKFSRNPQYVADIVMIIGWMLLCAAPLACILGTVGILVLLTAPFSEEIWLRETYGKEFERYSQKVRRFL